MVRAVLLFAIASMMFAPPASADASKLPLLPDGQYQTFETGFNIDNPRFVRNAIRRYQDDATEAGMRVKPFEIGWSEIEPLEGRYQLDEFEDRLASYRDQGWRPLVFLRAIDSDDITVPRYLKGTDEPMSLTDVDVSSPRFIERYNALMDEVVPLVRQYGGFAIMIVNEADNFLTPYPELTEQVTQFVDAVRDHVHGIDPDMAVGVALSNGFDYDDDLDLIRDPLPHHLALIEASDIAVFNFYCRRVPLADQSASVRQRIDARIRAANGKDVIFQEVGCPSGGADGFSLEHQRQFFAQYFQAVSDTSVRVSVVFQLVDWTQATIDFYGNALQPLMDAEPAFRDNPELIFVYLNQLSTIGIVDATTGEPKPAWFEFLNAIEPE